jgi:glycine betaine/proline transport system permease protein
VINKKLIKRLILYTILFLFLFLILGSASDLLDFQGAYIAHVSIDSEREIRAVDVKNILIDTLPNINVDDYKEKDKIVPGQFIIDYQVTELREILRVDRGDEYVEANHNNFEVLKEDFIDKISQTVEKDEDMLDVQVLDIYLANWFQRLGRAVVSWFVDGLPIGKGIENGLDFLNDNISPATKAFSTIVEGGFDKIVQLLDSPTPIDIVVIFNLFIFIALIMILLNVFVYRKYLTSENIIRIFWFLITGTVMIIITSFGPPHPLIIIALLSVAAWRLADLKVGLFTLVGFALIYNLNLWDPTITTLALVLISTLLAILIGIPLGILAGVSKGFYKVITPILDFMQTMPAFVYLIPAIPFFGLGAVSAVFATVIFSIPPAIRLTALGIKQVPKDLIEASDAFGSTRFQRLIKIQLPLATPTIMAGINQTIMLSLSMVVIAAMIGAKGLGGEVWKAIQRLNLGLGFEAGLSVVIVAMVLDRITQHITKGSGAKRKQNIIARVIDRLIKRLFYIKNIK